MQTCISEKSRDNVLEMDVFKELCKRSERLESDMANMIKLDAQQYFEKFGYCPILTEI